MEKFMISAGTVLLAALALFLLIPLATIAGAICGWVVGLFFAGTILGILAQLGVTGITMWQFGAFMGFIGGFLRVSVTQKSS